MSIGWPENKDGGGRILIDPPVGPYHSREEVEDWIAQLEAMPASVDRDMEIRRAKRWLRWADEVEDTSL